MKKMKTEKQSSTGVPLKCSYCKKEFKYESDKKRHESSHNPQFMCKVCSKSFSFLSALRRHEKQHSRSGSVVCNKCTRSFRDETLLNRHIKYAHKGTFICPECLIVFNSEAALRTHSLTHQPESERRYHCQFDGCKKSFNFPHHLRNHELTHTNEKKYFCNVCGKGFIQAQNLKNHLNTHEPDAMLCCTVEGCKKKFSTEYTRKKHVAAHNIATKERKLMSPKVNGVLCPSCGDLIPQRKVETHIKKCVLNQEKDENYNKVDVMVNTSTENEEIKDNNMLIVKKKGPAKANYCKTALGRCMTSGGPDMEDNCLCAQMSEDIKVLDNNLDFGTNDTMNTEPDNTSIDIEPGCSCDCGKTIDAPMTRIVSNPVICKGSMPSLEFRADGVIKLKDTFDLNIPFVQSAGSIEKTIDNIPNSCKASFGNCIVSGDDTIGAGCLCARMTTEGQQFSEQEIEEITIGNGFDT